MRLVYVRTALYHPVRNPLQLRHANLAWQATQHRARGTKDEDIARIPRTHSVLGEDYRALPHPSLLFILEVGSTLRRARSLPKIYADRVTESGSGCGWSSSLELFCNPMNVILHRKTSDIGEYSEEVKIICFASKQSHARDLQHGRENDDRDHESQRHVDKLEVIRRG